MAKPVDFKAAKAAKQKKIAIGGAVLLLALMAFSVPKTLKMISRKPPVQSAVKATSTTAPSTTPATAAPTTPGTLTAPPAGATPTTSQVSQVLNDSLAPSARDGQLSRLSTFSTKDPFVAQMKVDSPGSADVPPASGAKASTTAAAPSVPAQPARKPTTLRVLPQPPASPPNAPATPSGPSTPTAPAAAEPLQSATISVNGAEEGVNLASDFPAAAPLFRLVLLTATTAKVSVAGGSLASGAPTLTLHRGKPLTLMNTADGTRYRLVLVSTSKTAAAPPATTTTPATTTPTTTPTPGG